MESKIHLSESFTYSKLLRFTLPSIVMNIFSSLYTVADGFFVANFAGKTEFAAVNLIMPVLTIMGIIGYMFGAGGIWCALVFAEMMAAIVGSAFMVALRRSHIIKNEYS